MPTETDALLQMLVDDCRNIDHASICSMAIETVCGVMKMAHDLVKLFVDKYVQLGQSKGFH